jgi:hypothetical protein
LCDAYGTFAQLTSWTVVPTLGIIFVHFAITIVVNTIAGFKLRIHGAAWSPGPIVQAQPRGDSTSLILLAHIDSTGDALLDPGDFRVATSTAEPARQYQHQTGPSTNIHHLVTLGLNEPYSSHIFTVVRPNFNESCDKS